MEQSRHPRARRTQGHARQPVATAGRRLELFHGRTLDLVRNALAAAEGRLGERLQVALVGARERGK